MPCPPCEFVLPEAIDLVSAVDLVSAIDLVSAVDLVSVIDLVSERDRVFESEQAEGDVGEREDCGRAVYGGGSVPAAAEDGGPGLRARQSTAEVGVSVYGDAAPKAAFSDCTGLVTCNCEVDRASPTSVPGL